MNKLEKFNKIMDDYKSGEIDKSFDRGRKLLQDAIVLRDALPKIQPLWDIYTFGASKIMTANMFDMTSIVSMVVLAAYQAGQNSVMETKLDEIKERIS